MTPTPDMLDALGLTPEDMAKAERENAERDANRTEAMKRVYAASLPREGGMWGKPLQTRQTGAKRPDGTPRRKNKTPEGDVVRECSKWLHDRGIFFFRINNLPSPIYGSNGQVIGLRPVSMKGLPDALAVIHGATVMLEFKSATGTQRPEQKVVEEKCKAAGGHYFLIRSVEELERNIKPLL